MGDLCITYKANGINTYKNPICITYFHHGYLDRPLNTHIIDVFHMTDTGHVSTSNVVERNVLLGAGLGLALLSRHFYRAKMTTPFKISYFLTWPVLGTGIIQLVQTQQQVEINQRLEKK